MAMVSRQISISRVLELQVHVSWQEAVAVAGEVVVRRDEAVAAGRSRPRIDPDACILTPLGEVKLTLPAYGDQPDAELQVLRALLAGRDMPADLEAVAYGPAPPSLGDALAMFWRPSRRADIAAVALRAISAEDDFEATSREAQPPPAPLSAAVTPIPDDADQVAGLRAQVSDRAAARIAPPVPAAPARPRPGVRATSAVAAAVLTAAAGVGLWMAGRPSASSATDPSPDAPLPDERLDVRVPESQRDTDIDLSRPRARRAQQPADEPLFVPDPGEVPAGASGSPDSPATALAPPDAGASDGLPAEPYPTPGDAVIPAEPPVYSWRSAGVVPPEMMFPRMPASAFPPPGAEIAGIYVEILVSEAGTVEAVRVRGASTSTASAHRHSMILAAAKAWQFMPATLDDVPVRYVTRVYLEQ